MMLIYYWCYLVLGSLGRRRFLERVSLQMAR
jgi:hypothetical protein